MSQTKQLEELLAWLHLPTPKERYHYLQTHLELLTFEYDDPLDVFIGLFSDQPSEHKQFRYGAIVVTARYEQERLIVNCPACGYTQTIEHEQLGQEITCPTQGCLGGLRVNCFWLTP